MFKKISFLIIFLMVFTLTGFTTDYRYTQESGTGFFVATPDKADALEDENELRQIVNDLGALIGHSKMDGTYPKDGTTGGTATYTGDGSLLTGVGTATETGLTVRVKEENTSPITKGQPVYVSGSTGAAFPKVGLADSDDTAKYEVIGLAAENISQNAQGLIRVGGILEGVDSLGATAINPDNETWLASDLLFLHTTAGGLTKTEPTTGRVIEVGFSMYGSSNTDAILLMIHSPHIHIEVNSGEDIVFRMGDSAGSNKTIFKGYDNVEVASVDSDGKADLNELLLDTVLAIAEGGTNSGTALNNDFVIISNTGAIVESATITITELGLLNGLSGIQPLDTALTNISALVYSSPSFIKLTANDTYAVRTLSEVRTDLGLVIGTNIMAWDAQLDDIAALAYADSNFIVGDGSNWVAESGLTARTSMGAEGILTNEAGLYSALNDVTDFVQAGEANSIDSDMYTDGSIDHEHLAADVISGMVEVTSADEDYILIWDASDSALKKVDMGEVRGGVGYTNLTSFVDQTAWRLFYSNTDGDVIELAFGDDGKFLMSNGAAAGLTFEALPVADTDTTGVLTDTDWDTFNDKEPELTDAASLYSTLSDVTLFLEELKDDTTPELGGPLDFNNERATEVKTIEFNGVYAIGVSGSTETVDWQNGAYQSITIDEACVISFSNEYVGILNLRVTYGGSFALTFGGMTLLEEGGVEIVTTDATGVDELMFKNWGTADTYTMGAMLDVKD